MLSMRQGLIDYHFGSNWKGLVDSLQVIIEHPDAAMGDWQADQPLIEGSVDHVAIPDIQFVGAQGVGIEPGLVSPGGDWQSLLNKGPIGFGPNGVTGFQPDPVDSARGFKGELALFRDQPGIAPGGAGSLADQLLAGV